MPLYEFTCQHCRERFEILGSFSLLEGDPPACEHCGSSDTTRNLSTGAVFRREGRGQRVSAAASSCSSCSASPTSCAGCSSGG